MIEGWFLNVPIREIKRDNFAIWSGWAFFDKVAQYFITLTIHATLMNICKGCQGYECFRDFRK